MDKHITPHIVIGGKKSKGWDVLMPNGTTRWCATKSEAIALALREIGAVSRERVTAAR